MPDGSVIVTGGAAGIGRACARLAAERGADVAVLDIDGEGAGRVADELAGHGGRAVGLACDVRVEEQVAEAVSTATRELGPPRGAVLCAGIDPGGRLAHELDAETWQRTLAINLSGTFFAAKHVLRALLDAGRGGALVLISSPLAVIGFPDGTSAYSASKGGISAMMRTLAVDYASHGIRVNTVLPGPTETALMWVGVAPDDVDRMRELVNSEVPLGRLAQPVEIAYAALWLLSDEARYVTGAELACDGGVLSKSSLSI